MDNISLFKKIKSAKIIKEPFVHVCIENALEDELYKDIKKNFPKQSLFIDDCDYSNLNNQRFNIYNNNLDKLKIIHKSIINFMNYHSSINFWKEIQHFFGEDIVKINNKHFNKLDDLKKLKIRENMDSSGQKDLYLHCSASLNTPVNKVSSVRSVHLDNSDKMYVGLYYIRDEDDHSTGGDLLLYKWSKSISDKEKIKIIQENDLENNCKVFNKIKYKPNTFIFFLNNLDALHGVSERQITTFSRNFFYFSGIYSSSLFNINRYNNKFMNKIKLKLKKFFFY